MNTTMNKTFKVTFQTAITQFYKAQIFHIRNTGLLAFVMDGYLLFLNTKITNLIANHSLTITRIK